MSYEELPEPYRSAALLPFSLSGWFFNHGIIQYLFQRQTIETCIEVGSWLGASTLFMASLMQGGRLYAVDHWLGSEENQVSHELPTLYRQFLSNVVHAGYADIIVPIRSPSLEAAEAFEVQADLIYIDASHKEEDVLADLVAWYPHLKKGGIFCGDDWKWPSVRSAVRTFACTHNLFIDDIENFWHLYA